MSELTREAYSLLRRDLDAERALADDLADVLNHYSALANPHLTGRFGANEKTAVEQVLARYRKARQR